MDPSHVIVMSTTDSETAARALATVAVEAKLAACAQIVGPLTSVFTWEGEVRTEREWRVEFKTTADRVAALVKRLEAEHTYDVPEIVVCPIAGGSRAYLSWVDEATR